MYIRDTKNSKLITKDELQWIGSNDTTWNTENVDDVQLSEKYKLPKYEGQNVTEYKEKIQSVMK